MSNEFLDMWNDSDASMRWFTRVCSAIVVLILFVVILGIGVWIWGITPMGDNDNRNPRVGWVDEDDFSYRCEGPNMVYKKYRALDVVENDPRCLG